MQTFKYAIESSAEDPASSIQRRTQNFLLSYRSTPHATNGSSLAKLFLQRELHTRLSLVTPDIGSRVASQQNKMKCNHDKFAKHREMAVDDCVLARDNLSGQKWHAGSFVQQTSPASHWSRPSIPIPPTPAPRRSKCATKPPQRRIEEMD